MQHTLFLCICSVVLILVQNGHGHPAEASKDTAVVEDTKLDRLLTTVVADFTSLAHWLAEANVKTINAALEEAKNKHEHNITEYVNELKDYVEFTKKISTISGEEKITQVFKLFEMGVNILDKYNDDELKENDDAGLKEMATLLKSNGQYGNHIKLGANFLTWGENIEQRVKSYIAALEPSEKTQNDNVKIIEWYEKLVKERDAEKRMNIYSDFFELFDD